MPDFILDMSIGYIVHKKQTGHDFCELLLLVFEESLKILRNGILLLQWNLWGGLLEL